MKFENIKTGDLQSYIGKRTIVSLYVYINKKGIKSIRIHLNGSWCFYNFNNVKLI